MLSVGDHSNFDRPTPNGILVNRSLQATSIAEDLLIATSDETASKGDELEQQPSQALNSALFSVMSRTTFQAHGEALLSTALSMSWTMRSPLRCRQHSAACGASRPRQDVCPLLAFRARLGTISLVGSLVGTATMLFALPMYRFGRAMAPKRPPALTVISA
ncbi:hypothetical protein CC79DRAFT_543030 [Sarocladium strictum]